jgi:anti-anti-sigma factor
MAIDDSSMAGPASSWVVPEFSVSTRVLDREALVAVRGELDLATGPVLSDSVHCHDGHYERIVFDLSDLSFIDVAGFRALLQCADEKQVMTIRSPSPAVRRLLGLLERDSLIEDESGQ